MRRSCKWAALCLAAFTAAPAAEIQGVPKHPRELKFPPLSYTPPKPADYRHKLSNGAVAFLVEDHDFPLVNISVLIRTGEYLDPPGKVGLASLTGSQIRSGGTQAKPPAVFDEEVAFLAANIGSGIGDVEGSANLNCLKSNLDQSLALFVEMLRSPGFAEDRLKLARSQILQQMERRNDSTAGIEQREFARLLRGEKHFSTAQVTKASLEAITRQDLIDFHAKYYYPGNFVLAVSGDFDTKDMLARLEKAFAGWPNRDQKIAPVPKPEYTPSAGIYLVDKKDVNQGRVRMGHLGTLITNPDHVALSVMNGILGGGGFTSRIMSRVRSDEGLAYSAGSAFHHGVYYEGSFLVGFQSKSPTVAQAIAIVREEIEKLRTGKVTQEELETEKNQIIESFPNRFATAGAIAGQFASDYFTGLPEDYWQKFRDRVRAITVDEVQRVASKYLHPDKLTILIVGNVDDILKGNPDRPQFQLTKLGFGAEVTRIPLPDPLTMVYPKQ
jgi:predicted Zn-dependent peptidase